MRLLRVVSVLIKHFYSLLVSGQSAEMVCWIVQNMHVVVEVRDFLLHIADMLK